MEGFDRPPEGDEGAPGFGGNGEAAQLRVAHPWQPGEQRMAARRTQHLLDGPEHIAPAGRPDHGELGEVDPGSGQRRGIRQVRRCEPHNTLACTSQGGERRQEQTELADGLVMAKDLGKGGSGPSAAGELRVQGRKASRQGRRGARQGRAPPDALLLEEVFQGRLPALHTVLLYSITCRPSTSAALRLASQPRKKRQDRGAAMSSSCRLNLR